jgi:hypothetical protein
MPWKETTTMEQKVEFSCGWRTLDTENFSTRKIKYRPPFQPNEIFFAIGAYLVHLCIKTKYYGKAKYFFYQTK